ncbi:MAG: hypothetical protein A3J63_04450 [Candidatus Moranbacteria bacterium RIFCSPHIGHO2_02_FULL_40_12b]|nr:MAG: hypothetical protein A3J63_04450 [Candidatus Moranbacteria bacterium RIFCSPHIGHO2_02_FULL_40_12b]OGI23887.1 MAG: hypothetical protein A3E91_00530 [Candidatus Moranbacteria bacterium RIFCSPHIGHO2_12_FULL_40_10]
MDIQKILSEFKKKIDLEIKDYLNKAVKEARKKDYLISEALRYVKKFVLSGGKRLRAAMMYYGYLSTGGKEKEKILKTAVSIELIHAFLLIHDDIIDRDEKRHGTNTVHFRYQKLGKRIFPESDYRHFGSSMAIIIGDMVGAIGSKIIFNSGFNTENVFRALTKLQEIISMTVIGESKDIYMDYKGEATEKEVLQMYEYKTAKYTIEGPLHLGAILGGAGGKILKGLSAFAIPVGIAFQIQDDILGVFGSEKKTGKSEGSDIREGKQTILVVKAREKMNPGQKKIFSGIFGKKNLTRKDIEDFRKIIIDTGALEYSKNFAKKLVIQGKKEMEKLEISESGKDFMRGIADYMINREL